MARLRQLAGGLILLSGVMNLVRFVFLDPSSNFALAATVFGVCFVVIGLMLIRGGPVALWLGAIVPGIAGVLGNLVVLGTRDILPTLQAAIAWFVFVICISLLFRLGKQRVVVGLIAVLVTGCGVLPLFLLGAGLRDPVAPIYDANCSICHGENFEGLTLGPPLVGRDLIHGASAAQIANSISVGFPTTGMPAWSETLTDAEIQGLALMITEKRSGYSRMDFNVDTPLEVPEESIASERHSFRVETVASGLHPRPFSIAPLPDGRILLSEKTRGLSIISANGEQSALISGTPATHDDGFQLPVNNLVFGLGWMMDVALHPDYEENGWIYLHFGDRCIECDLSMNKLIRGRIENGRWIDEETIWQAAADTYTRSPDMGAGGRISFDDQGHVFLGVGIKGNSNYDGIQDLSRPYGKIHRMHDDGRIPSDNPFVDVPDALASTWTYGHRSPQGLEFDPRSGRLWSTEMGPRGGDELNLLMPGRNYGWPLYSLGIDYDGTPVEYGKQLGIELDLSTIEQPIVDMTPSPAVSSFIFYRGDIFPEWQNNAIVGTLKARELYRWEFDEDRVIHQETLLAGIGRIRDVEMGPDGAIYLLFEHASGGQIVRLVAD